MSKMKKPVDIKEFDYFLWKNANGQAYAKIKSTKEVIELTDDVFRFLRAEEKRMYRYIVKNTLKEPMKNKDEIKDSNDTEKKEMSEKNITSLLSLDVVSTDEKQSEKWLTDKTSIEENIISNIMLEDFYKSLTDRETVIVKECLINGVSNNELARKLNINEGTIRYQIKKIKNKKSFFK